MASKPAMDGKPEDTPERQDRATSQSNKPEDTPEQQARRTSQKEQPRNNSLKTTYH